jgi:hypothetical protein
MLELFFLTFGQSPKVKKNNSSIQKSFLAAVGGVICAYKITEVLFDDVFK